MRIVHALAGAGTELVDGASNSVWALAGAQAELGHDVTVVLRCRDALQVGAPAGVAVARWSDLAEVRAACRHAGVLHAHSAFCPRLAAVRRAVRGTVPVVVSPRGALARPVLHRHRCRKSAYALLVERPLVRAADLVLALSDAEERAVREFAGRRCPPVTVVPNPIRPLPYHGPAGRSDDVVYIGRFDALHKGLDRLCAVARRSRARFHLYGRPRAGDAATARLLARLPVNVAAHPPVFGEVKAAVLGTAGLYLQPSRWEVFGRSVAEAATAGTAVVVSAECDLAGPVSAAGCGVVTDLDDPDRAAADIDALLAAGAARRRAAMGLAGAAWAAASFSPARIAARTVEAYRGLR